MSLTFYQLNLRNVKEPWKSIYSPGGEREYILDYLVQFLWLTYTTSGGLVTFFSNLHKSLPPQNTAKPAPKPVSAPAAPEHAIVSSATNTMQKWSAKGRGNSWMSR
ncbi:uncharacterized protein BJ212DRAFT_1504237, partial [Suillus subaureus]